MHEHLGHLLLGPRGLALDLDVLTTSGRFLLDVSVFHAFLKGRKGQLRHVTTSEREKRKFERYPVHKNGQRVTDAALVPVILNTYGAVGEKASEFLFAVVGNEAKRIINEISLLAVLQSAEMILQSHAPSNLPNLLSIARSAQLASPPAVEQSDQSKGEDEGKDEGGFLRPDLRGEIQDKKVKCLGCSTESKNVFRIATLWNWNRHVQLVHSEASQQAAEPAAQQDTQPAIEPGVQPVAKRAPKRATQRATAKRVAKRATPPAAPQVASIPESAVRVPAVRVPDTVVCVPCIKDARAPSGFGRERVRE